MKRVIKENLPGVEKIKKVTVSLEGECLNVEVDYTVTEEEEEETEQFEPGDLVVISTPYPAPSSIGIFKEKRDDKYLFYVIGTQSFTKPDDFSISELYKNDLSCKINRYHFSRPGKSLKIDFLNGLRNSCRIYFSKTLGKFINAPKDNEIYYFIDSDLTIQKSLFGEESGC